jgi:FtsP/CotA-like multicopper oxidase with cupredoxin domain
MNTNVRIRILEVFLCLALVGVMAGTALAVTDVYLRAEATTLTLPNGAGGTTNIPVWGFARDSAFGAGDGTISVPGPVLKMPAGETVLNIHLDNNLPEPISLNISGQALTNNSGPVFSEPGDATVYPPGPRPAGNQTARVRSFSHETPPGNPSAVIYTYSLRPGTFLYSSGTNPAKQVQMGLYGALTTDVAPGEAYTGVDYTHELVMVYSEVDPAMNAAIDGGTYGPGGTITSSLHREPRYFLINGMAYDPAAPGGLDPIAFVDGLDKVLVRVINAGYELHVPEFSNTFVTLVAEDGNPRAYPTEQYSLEMPAGKVYDVLLTPSGEGRYAIHDAALHLTNNGTAATGGMLAYYGVACVGDLNQDGGVNFGDLALLRANFGNPQCPPGTPCPGDITKDGFVNFADLAQLRANFGSSGCPAAP